MKKLVKGAIIGVGLGAVAGACAYVAFNKRIREKLMEVIDREIDIANDYIDLAKYKINDIVDRAICADLDDLDELDNDETTLDSDDEVENIFEDNKVDKSVFERTTKEIKEDIQNFIDTLHNEAEKLGEEYDLDNKIKEIKSKISNTISDLSSEFNKNKDTEKNKEDSFSDEVSKLEEELGILSDEENEIIDNIKDPKVEKMSKKDKDEIFGK